MSAAKTDLERFTQAGAAPRAARCTLTPAQATLLAAVASTGSWPEKKLGPRLPTGWLARTRISLVRRDFMNGWGELTLSGAEALATHRVRAARKRARRRGRHAG